MRIVHRYLGYFMAGIMAMYALSGMLLVYRDTDFLKKENKYVVDLGPNMDEKKLAKAIKVRQLEDKHLSNDTLYFKQGFYVQGSGRAEYTKKELPYLLRRFTEIHKAKSANAWAPLNVVFGFTLFFFVLSSFWMFTPKSKIFKKGMLYALGGFVLAVLIVLFWQ